MDLGLKAEWNWGHGDNQEGDTLPFFRFHGDRFAYAAQVTHKAGCSIPVFDKAVTSRVLKTKKDWESWLEKVPQPDSERVKASLNVVLAIHRSPQSTFVNCHEICPRSPDTRIPTGMLRNPANLTHMPFPGGRIFKRLIETFHIHPAIQTILNRGWPIIHRNKEWNRAVRMTHYNFRCSNTLENDTALTITHIPDMHITYAIFFGYTDRQIETVFARLAFSGQAIFEPFTLINTFIQLEKVYRFEEIERHVDTVAELMHSFQHVATMEADNRISLTGVAGNVTAIRNGLIGWTRELKRFREKVVGDNIEPEYAAEYLHRVVDENEYMATKCDGLPSTLFQMEMSRIAQNEVNKMKLIAILTMLFLPATFVATFMSMGLFNWHPNTGEKIMSPYWWVYFAVTGGLTIIVFLVYFFRSRLAAAWSHRGQKSDRDLV